MKITATNRKAMIKMRIEEEEDLLNRRDQITRIESVMLTTITKELVREKQDSENVKTEEKTNG